MKLQFKFGMNDLCKLASKLFSVSIITGIISTKNKGKKGILSMFLFCQTIKEEQKIR